MKAAMCLVAVVIVTILAPAEEPRKDEMLALQPEPIRKACQDSCPDSTYRIFRIVEHQKTKPFTYTVTFFNVGPGTAWRKAGDDWIAELPQYDLELAADGHVLEEGGHDISPAAVPKTVRDGYN